MSDNKHHNSYHNTIKMKSVNVKLSTYKVRKLMIKMLNLKLVILLKYQNIKAYVPNWSEEVFVIKKVINTVLWTYAISDICY